MPDPAYLRQQLFGEYLSPDQSVNPQPLSEAQYTDKAFRHFAERHGWHEAVEKHIEATTRAVEARNQMYLHLEEMSQRNGFQRAVVAVFGDREDRALTRESFAADKARLETSMAADYAERETWRQHGPEIHKYAEALRQTDAELIRDMGRQNQIERLPARERTRERGEELSR
jgi:hypothetical protein